MPIRITDDIAIDEREIEESFVRSSGPGGQNVNKLSTAVQLRFDVRRSPSLPNDVAIRLMRLAGKRLTKDGVLVLVAQSHRTQERNRADALERLVALIQEAAVRAGAAPRHQADQGLEGEAAGGEESALQHQGHAAEKAGIGFLLTHRAPTNRSCHAANRRCRPRDRAIVRSRRKRIDEFERSGRCRRGRASSVLRRRAKTYDADRMRRRESDCSASSSTCRTTQTVERTGMRLARDDIVPRSRVPSHHRC